MCRQLTKSLGGMWAFSLGQWATLDLVALAVRLRQILSKNLELLAVAVLVVLVVVLFYLDLRQLDKFKAVVLVKEMYQVVRLVLPLVLPLRQLCLLLVVVV